MLGWGGIWQTGNEQASATRRMRYTYTRVDQYGWMFREEHSAVWVSVEWRIHASLLYILFILHIIIHMDRSPVRGMQVQLQRC